MTFDPLPPYVLSTGAVRAKGYAHVRVDVLPDPTVYQLRTYAMIDPGVGEGARAARAKREVEAWAQEALRQPKPWLPVTHSALVRLGYVSASVPKDKVFA